MQRERIALPAIEVQRIVQVFDSWVGALGLNPSLEALSLQLLVILAALATFSIVQRNTRLTRAVLKGAKG